MAIEELLTCCRNHGRQSVWRGHILTGSS